MSVRVMSWVFEHSESTGNDRLILLAIADRCDDDGGNCWKSTERLGLKARVSKRTAQRCIDHLVEMGELMVTLRPGTTSVLSVVMEGRQLDAPRGDSLTPRQVVTGDTVVAGGASPVTPDTSIHPNTPQPPADAGAGSPDHCDRHSRHRRSCSECRTAKSLSLADEFVRHQNIRVAQWACPYCDPDGWALDEHGEVTSAKCKRHIRKAAS